MDNGCGSATTTWFCDKAVISSGCGSKELLNATRRSHLESSKQPLEPFERGPPRNLRQVL